jgi:hypothetical protein
MEIIDILSPDNAEENGYVLKIHVRRNAKALPFYVEKIEIVPR